MPKRVRWKMAARWRGDLAVLLCGWTDARAAGRRVPNRKEEDAMRRFLSTLAVLAVVISVLGFVSSGITEPHGGNWAGGVIIFAPD